MAARLLFVFLVLSGAGSLGAQQGTPPPAPVEGWKHRLVAGLTLTQVSYTDWVQGGDNALGYTASLDGSAEDDFTGWNWKNMYKFAIGHARIGNQGLRKTDDIIDVASIATLKLNTVVNPYAAVTLKSQFAKGFTYDAAGAGTAVSKWFDPAYLTQSVGAGFKPLPEVTTRLGAAVREIVTRDFTVYSDDKSTPADTEKVAVDGGIESVTSVDWKLDENILFTSQLEFFAPVKALNELVTRNTTTITGSIGSYMTAILSVQIINEPKVSPHTQIKETIALGLKYSVF